VLLRGRALLLFAWLVLAPLLLTGFTLALGLIAGLRRLGLTVPILILILGSAIALVLLSHGRLSLSEDTPAIEIAATSAAHRLIPAARQPPMALAAR
jgi:hypothetical protein